MIISRIEILLSINNPIKAKMAQPSRPIVSESFSNPDPQKKTDGIKNTDTASSKRIRGYNLQKEEYIAQSPLKLKIENNIAVAE
jgi:hypothetical protein